MNFNGNKVPQFIFTPKDFETSLKKKQNETSKFCELNIIQSVSQLFIRLIRLHYNSINLGIIKISCSYSWSLIEGEVKTICKFWLIVTTGWLGLAVRIPGLKSQNKDLLHFCFLKSSFNGFFPFLNSCAS